MDQNIPNNCTPELTALLREAAALSVKFRLLAAELSGDESALAVDAGNAIRLVTVAAEAPATPASFREALLESLDAQPGRRKHFRDPNPEAARGLLADGLSDVRRLLEIASRMWSDGNEWDSTEVAAEVLDAYGKATHALTCALGELQTEPADLEGLTLTEDDRGRPTVKDWQGKVYDSDAYLPTGVMAGCAAVLLRDRGAP